MRVLILTEEGTNTVDIGVGEILDLIVSLKMIVTTSGRERVMKEESLDLEADQDHLKETTDQKSHAKLTI